eukprot:1119283-Prymnesium_polylepis.2
MRGAAARCEVRRGRVGCAPPARRRQRMAIAPLSRHTPRRRARSRCAAPCCDGPHSRRTVRARQA